MKKSNLKMGVGMLAALFIVVSCSKEEIATNEHRDADVELRAPLDPFDEMANSESHMIFMENAYNFVFKAGTEVSLEMRESSDENFIEDVEENYEETEFESVAEVQAEYKELLNSYVVCRTENSDYFKLVDASKETIENHFEAMGEFAGNYFGEMNSVSFDVPSISPFTECIMNASEEFADHVFWALSFYHSDGWAEEEIVHAYMNFGQQVSICFE